MEAIQQTITNMQQNFDTRMADFQSELQKAGTSTTSSPMTVSTLAAEFLHFKRFTINSFTSIQHQVALLAQNLDHFEMRSRCKILLVHGIPETKKEETNEVVLSLITHKLEIDNVTINDINRSHRMGRVKNDKPRPILVKFKTTAVKDKIWFAKTRLNSSGFTLSEFLTKGRHDAFMAARKHFGITKSWTRDGYVHIVTPDGVKHRVSSCAEVEKLATASSEAGASEAGISETRPSRVATTVTKTAAASESKATTTAAANRNKRNKK